MKELLRSNDPVRLSFWQALLSDAGIESYLFDSGMSVLEGSIGILPRRLMVASDDFTRACHTLETAGEWPP